MAKLAPAIIFVAFSVALYGAGQGMALPTAMVWVGDVVSEEFYGRFSSYLGAFGYLGQFAVPLIFAPVLNRFGISNLFLTAGGVSVFLLVIVSIGNRFS